MSLLLTIYGWLAEIRINMWLVWIGWGGYCMLQEPYVDTDVSYQAYVTDS